MNQYTVEMGRNSMLRKLIQPNYLYRTRLEVALTRNLEKSLLNGSGIPSQRSIVLDLGSGTRLYEKLFPNYRYYALDIALLNNPNVVGVGENLPLASKSVDLILCIQVLEHVDQPESVIREISRILKPGGRIHLTTHGAMFYHPTPQDHWRWTQSGLVKLFERNGTFSEIYIEPVQGTFGTLGYFFSWYTHILFQILKGRFVLLTWPILCIEALMILTINVFALFLDWMLPAFGNIKNSNTLIGIFFVNAKKSE